jgi:hypothetical protein
MHGRMHLPLQIELPADTLAGMDTDPGPDAKGQRASRVPDIPGTLGLDWPKGQVWAVTETFGLPDWREVRHPAMPSVLHLRVRVAPTMDGLAAVAALIEREDGHPLHAQDLRKVKLPPAWVLASSLGPQAASPRPGPRGKGDEHWRAVYDMWIQAQRVAPHSPVRWMLTQWQPEVSDGTMRRWVKRARERAKINKWEEGDQ